MGLFLECLHACAKRTQESLCRNSQEYIFSTVLKIAILFVLTCFVEVPSLLLWRVPPGSKLLNKVRSIPAYFLKGSINCETLPVKKPTFSQITLISKAEISKCLFNSGIKNTVIKHLKAYTFFPFMSVHEA